MTVTSSAIEAKVTSGRIRLLGLPVVLVGIALVGIALLGDLLRGQGAGFGLLQALVLSFGAAVIMAGLDLREERGEVWRASLALAVRRDLIKLLVVVAELVLVVQITKWFQIETPALAREVVPLAAAGFVLHHLLPAHRRLTLFVVLSLAGFVVVLGWANAAWLASVILLFMGLCHIPVAPGIRTLLLVLGGIGLGVLRLQPAWTPFSGAIWPLLGSILMFRLIVYWYDVRHATERTPLTWSLAYFFLLPNIVFPLFPVVDFATFRRTYYDQDPFAIYQRGLDWILRGLVQLLVYRVVYQHLTVPPAEVITGTLLVQYMVTTFLLYLRVSGTFHMIVGMLHLFGFRLPETHRFFYLASSFSDFWRRINIYWKDFMMKVVFYPVYFPMRKRGETTALVMGTLAVFFVTWVTHAYQWFWILGTWLLTWTDALFWAILGVLLVANSLREAKVGRKRTVPGQHRRSWNESARTGLRAAGVFAVLCTLWSMWGSPTMGEWFDLMTVQRFDLRDWAAVFGVLAFIAVTATLADRTGKSMGDVDRGPARAHGLSVSGTARTFAGLAVILLLAAPQVSAFFGPRAQEFAREMRFPELNKRDAQELQRGYYENLQGVNQNNSQLWELYAAKPTEGQDIWKSGVLAERSDFLAREMKPLFGIYQGGNQFRTNRWGMRDRDYPTEKPAGTFRVALMGQSYVAGDGVSDGETFDEVVEDRLASDSTPGMPRVEILNFAVGSYSLMQQLTLLDMKAFSFQPDLVVLVAHPEDPNRLAIHLVQQIRRGVPPPWAFPDSILRAARVTQDLRETEALSRLAPYRDALVAWAEAQIVQACRAKGIRAAWMYLDVPARAPDGELVKSRIARAQAEGFRTLDFSDIYQGHDLHSLQASSWDFHPNVAAHRLIADRFYQMLTADTALGFAH